jgi:two-component system chemotaxis response regulator CheB
LGARTFAQDEASSAVFGMPRAAMEVGATQTLLSVDKVADFLVRTSLAPEVLSS